MPVRMTDDLQPENTQCWGMSPVTALLRAACVSPGSLHGHRWPETLHQHCPSPDRSQWLPDLPHLGLYLLTLLLVTTSGHGVFSLSLTFCPLKGHFLQMPPHHAWREHSFLSVLLPLSICDCGPHENYVRHQEYTQRTGSRCPPKDLT